MSLDSSESTLDSQTVHESVADKGMEPRPASDDGQVIHHSRIERLSRAEAAERLPEFRALLQLALRAQERARVPYSKFHVGAALLTGSGQMVAGCNVESASYGATICAERTAVGSAVTAGESTIRACIIVTPTREPSSPCGICRQLLAEFGPDVLIMAASSVADGVNVGRLSDFLPLAFWARDLDDAATIDGSGLGDAAPAEEGVSNDR